MKTPSDKTEYDLILFGATSFVGRILAEYLKESFGRGESGLRWAMAGRNLARLEKVRASLGAGADALPLIQADALDEHSIESMCEQTRVVVTTVGPYAKFGEPLVRVCARTGADYCDLAGEVHWIRRMITRYEDDARRSGACIVHCCGFDSIPSDLGVYFLQQEVKRRFGKPAVRVKMRVRAMHGGMSGGTAASMINMIKDAAGDPQVRRELADSYSLCPSKQGFFAPQPEVRSARFDPDFQAWLAPFLMAPVNTRVVLRSNALAGNPYGKDFRYDEAVMTGCGFSGSMRAVGLSAGIELFMLSAALPPTRRLLERFVLPKPGEGPDPESREKGFFDLRFLGKTIDRRRLCIRVFGDRDPGYGATSRMLGQAAICLAHLNAAERKGGFWTPATLLGDRLIERLNRYAGMRFEVLE